MKFIGGIRYCLILTLFFMAVNGEEISKNETTPSPPQTTSVKPKPTTPLPPEPKVSKWIVRDEKTNVSCIMMDAGIRMTFNNNTGKKVENIAVDVPAEGVVVTGFCQENEQIMMLSFKNDWLDCLLSFTFSKNKSASKYDLSRVSLTYSFPPEISKTVSENVTMFVTDEHSKYKCMSSLMLVNRTTGNETVGLRTINTFSLTVEAFRNVTTETYSNKENHCPQDEVSQLVPIIVGAVLAGLIVIVLIAYLIGRKRSRQGYESV